MYGLMSKRFPARRSVSHCKSGRPRQAVAPTRVRPPETAFAPNQFLQSTEHGLNADQDLLPILMYQARDIRSIGCSATSPLSAGRLPKTAAVKATFDHTTTGKFEGEGGSYRRVTFFWPYPSRPSASVLYAELRALIGVKGSADTKQYAACWSVIRDCFGPPT
jgi:hypothetical protein